MRLLPTLALTLALLLSPSARAAFDVEALSAAVDAEVVE